MNASTENQSSPHSDELPDRLLDLALGELVGGKSPPDLSARILAVQPQLGRHTSKPAAMNRERSSLKWFALAIAAMLLVGLATLLLPSIQSHRQTALRDFTVAAQLQNHHEATKDFPLPQLINESTVSRTKSPPAVAIAAGTRSSSTDQKRIKEGKAVSSSSSTRESTRIVDRSALQLPQPASVNGGDYIGGPVSEFRMPAGSPAAGLDVGGPMQASQDRLGAIAIDRSGPEAANPEIALLEAARGRRLGYEWRGSIQSAEGTGARLSGDKYTPIVENPFVKAEGGAAVSTFSIDVDTASYANVRQFLMEMNQLPPPDAVRVEELVNYFHYDYAPPAPGSAGGSTEATSDTPPFAAHVEVASCPWNAEHRLARIAVKGREMDRNKRPQSNLVFLVDVSGSMNEPAKLPLVVYGLEQLTRELGENDHIAIVVYAGTEGVVLPSTSGSKQDTILAALARLQAGGSTAGGAGIQLAYQIAEDNFIKGGTNRVILCTDGDFNVGVTSTAELQRMVEKKAKETGVFISTLGFGRGNLNDAMMVAISDHGNGNYHYIDNRTEARRVLVQEMTGTLVTIAKDVKIQVEFNPAQVAGYRLIGYEKRMLRTEDFNDDKKDAGEIGAGHTVTALYEIVPADTKVDVSPTDPLKYQQPATEIAGSSAKPSPSPNTSKELLTLKMRYKAPDGDTSKKLEWPITDDGKSFSTASPDTKFSASVAGFGLLLRDSQYKGNLTYAAVQELAQGGLGEDPHGYRKEFLEMVRRAKELRHE